MDLPSKWLYYLENKPETGMGYHIVSIILNSGERYNQVVVVEGRITEIRNIAEIPFKSEDIKEIILTHDKWRF